MRVYAMGSATPEYVLTNDELSTMVETNDEWIRTRTGISERHIAKGETTLSLSLEAAKQALDRAGEECQIAPEQIDLVICATLGSQRRCPNIATYLQRELGLREDILAFDLNAACSGFLYALITSSKLLDDGKHALVIGCDVLSHFVDFSDRSTCVLFGDGAGAAVITKKPTNEPQDFYWVSEARGSDILTVETAICMDGQGVFKFAVEAIVRNVKSVLAKAQLALEDVDIFVCHQANERILNSAARRLGVPVEKFFMNLAKYGNTSAASIPLALDEALQLGKISKGSKVVLAGFGGGLTAGAISMTWA